MECFHFFKTLSVHSRRNAVKLRESSHCHATPVSSRYKLAWHGARGLRVALQVANALKVNIPEMHALELMEMTKRRGSLVRKAWMQKIPLQKEIIFRIYIYICLYVDSVKYLSIQRRARMNGYTIKVIVTMLAKGRVVIRGHRQQVPSHNTHLYYVIILMFKSGFLWMFCFCNLSPLLRLCIHSIWLFFALIMIFHYN